MASDPDAERSVDGKSNIGTRGVRAFGRGSLYRCFERIGRNRA
jgi:hypothetical protein